METQTLRFIDAYRSKFIDLFYDWAITAIEQGSDTEEILYLVMKHNVEG